MDRDSIHKAVNALLDGRTRNDLQRMLDRVSPNIVYVTRGARAPFWGAKRREGKDEIERVLRELASEFENKGSVVHNILIDGDRVAVERTATLRHRGTNIVAEVDIVNFLRFQDGMVVEFSELFDSLTIERMRDNLPP